MITRRFTLVTLALVLFAPKLVAQIDLKTLTANLSEVQAARYERFADFRIEGVCGSEDLDIAKKYGANTIRNYTIRNPEEALELLDRAHALGLKVILSEWMPNQGENPGEYNSTWTHDYNASRDRMLASFVKKIEAIGDHPALLMWGLGNEVHLDEPYLKTVEQMSKAIHERFPHHLTSLTMINAKPENIEKIKQFTPDLDVIGVQSYSVGAIKGGIRNMEKHWKKPFYYSEFNGKGPWNFEKTEWGEAYDNLVPDKVRDIELAYEAIHASPLNLGSTIFTFGHFGMNRPTYFSLRIAEHPDGRNRSNPDRPLLITPQAEAMARMLTGDVPSENLAPVLHTLQLPENAKDITQSPGQRFIIHLEASDENNDQLRLFCWVLDSKPSRARAHSGPFAADASGKVTITAPNDPGEYLIMAYVVDDMGGASASTAPLLVK